MAEESRLSIIIDSRGAEKSATSLSDALDRVERSGDEAAGSTSRLSEVTVRLGSNMSKAAAATVASLSRIERATESTSSQMTALVSRAVALENAMSSVGQGIGRLDTGITQSNAQLAQLNTQMSHLVSTFSTFSQGQSAINAQLSRIAANMSRAADETQNLDQSTSRAGRGAREAASDLDAERAGLARLLGQINPTVAALDRLDDMQQRLTRYKNLRLVDAETVAEYTERLKAMRNALGDAEGGMNRTGMSAKALSANMRMLPAQITDIVVGLSSGQAPLTVLLQQGGQLKDMFGGIGPAARAVGGYIAGLVNPYTIAAAAAGVLALAFYQGSVESSRLTNALVKNGNAAGTTAGQLSVFAQQVGAGNATVAQAASALTQLAGAGNQLTILYPKIAAAAISWSKVTDQSVEEVVDSFNDLAKNPVDAVKKLDDQLNFLTASQYANIQSLQEQGRTMDAARLATEAYANALASRSTEMEQNLGVVEKAWNGLKSAAKSAWDAMLDIGRTESPEQQLQKVYKQIENAQKGIGRGGRAAFGLGISQPSLDALYKRAADLQAKIAADGAKNLEQATNNAIQAAGKKGIDTINTTFAAAQTQTEKLQKQLVELDKARKAAMEAGGFTAEEETKFAVARKNIEQQIADIKAREAKKSAPKTRGQNVGVREADNTASRLLAQYDPAGQAVRTLTKEQQQLDLAWRKGKITLDEYGKALAQASLNYAAAIKGAQGLTAAEQYQAQMERQLSIQRQQYAAQAAAVGMGSKEAERYQQRLQLEQQTNDRVLQLRTELAQATTEKQRQELQAQIDLTNEYLPQQVAAMEAGWAQMDAAMANPINGWTAAVQNFGAQAANVAGQTQSIFSSAFETLTSGISESITSLNFSLNTLGDLGKEVLKNIIAGFVKMGVQLAANAVLAMTLGASQTAATVAMAGTTAAAWAPAAAFASIATLGGAAIPASAALTSTTALASSLAVIPGLATGGMVNGAGTGTSDSNLRWLSNGEFVVNAEATRRNRSLLEAINSNDRIPSGGAASSSSSGATASAGLAPEVNIFNAPPGTQANVRMENAQWVLDVVCGSMEGDGQVHQVMAGKYGVTTVGR
ncbi:tail length tape measure protein [Pseudomonas aeruginosa]|uniref:phage tail length tape measure family protein n=1 Tax=Pseudomonas aeruginosa TaxID=287 RepID=UPI00074457C3|nr:phage tail length tape measure family protein [Pseudomonas aeruginosa]ALZ09077.1 tail length tape measure protein [Pseudomonas aeruginosa]MCO2282523.1 tail length tape measure protein [Pseudomonas aeruginosa]MCO2308586.1 tail length tape measure protein [Pseudomonas aeruginosa]MCO2900887.1 tail length tape measure protein [Pseudomonas aeruginosa]HBO3081866.1 phage tail length tape measure family protein [Pseudomonas aeruginosa]